jgi:toxin CcdB
MSQFDVFRNPVTGARRAYPFVVVLESDVASGGRQRAVAPAAPRTEFPAIAGRLTPIVRIERREFVLLITGITAIPANSLDKLVASLAERRGDILAAIDYHFFGV